MGYIEYATPDGGTAVISDVDPRYNERTECWQIEKSDGEIVSIPRERIVMIGADYSDQGFI